MSFLKKIEVENGVLGIWELTDTTDSLVAVFQFSESEEAEFKRFSLKKRQAEYLSTRLLLQQMLGAKTEITYQKSGRPQIKNSTKNISISHSADFVAIFISDDLSGIDVEIATRSIDKVTHRFLHKNELDWIEKSENPQFLKILFWCAKEAVYKCSNREGVQFDTQIFINPFDFGKTDCLLGKLTTQNQTDNYSLHYFSFKNNIFVYCVEVKNKF